MPDREQLVPVTFRLKGKVRVSAIMEHHRTIRGRRNPVTGEASTESVNLGWWIHLEFEGGTYAFRYGPERPEGIQEGDEVTVAIWK